ncbi:MAG: XdhC family protein [Saprospiraceae bacterium]|nr:XdhC family protein [Saprospiraceae bacterium]
MRGFLRQIESKEAEKRQLAVAVVTKTWGSAPRPIGSMLLIADDGSLFGSVSGGCVEGQVAKIAQEVIKTQAARLLSFGVSDDDAWAVGLSCGGNIEVLILPLFSDAIRTSVLETTAQNRGGVWLTPLSSGHNIHAYWQPQARF